MPWPTNGGYYIFKEGSIKAKAPPVSGVYGLYNIKHYVLIGESADIREALLRHEKETGLLLGVYRPLGFTFEVCSPDLRAQRAEQLVAEYRPVLQMRDLLAFVRSRRELKNHDAFESSDGAEKNGIPGEATPVLMVDNPQDRKRFYFSRDQVVVLALAFAVTAVSIGFLGLLTGKRIEATRIVNKENSPAKVPVASPVDTPGPKRAAETSEGVSDFKALTNGPDLQPAKEEASKQDQVPDKAAAVRSQKRPLSQPTQREEPVKTWTVQVKSSANKNSADVWVDRLKTKGYNAFVVEADIQGSTWYRVRVGPFDTRQDAETLRKVLESKEGFSDAFLAN
jgi:DedD protein